MKFIEKGKKSLQSIKIVFRSSSIVLKSAVLVVILLPLAALLALHSSLNRETARQEQLRQQAVSLKVENSSLQEDLGKLGSEESVKEIAKDRLGLVDPDTILLRPVGAGHLEGNLEETN